MHIEYLNTHEDVGKVDLKKIIRLDKEFFPTPWSSHSWETLFSEPRVLAILYRGNDIIGFTLFNVSNDDHFAHLLKIIIDPNLRNRGNGKFLLREVMNYLGIKHGIRNYFLEVEENNHEAVSTYRAMGFEQIHIKKDFYGKNKPALIMTLSI